MLDNPGDRDFALGCVAGVAIMYAAAGWVVWRVIAREDRRIRTAGPA